MQDMFAPLLLVWRPEKTNDTDSGEQADRNNDNHAGGEHRRLHQMIR